MAGQGVRKLDAAAGRRLRDSLERDGYQFARPQYTQWSAKGPGVSVTLYENGKQRRSIALTFGSPIVTLDAPAPVAARLLDARSEAPGEITPQADDAGACDAQLEALFVALDRYARAGDLLSACLGSPYGCIGAGIGFVWAGEKFEVASARANSCLAAT